MSEEAAFLEALKANPADDVTRLVYADWLDEHSEPAKAEYLRSVVAFARADVSALEHIHAIAENLPADWRLAVAARFVPVLESFTVNRKIEAIKLVRELTGMGLGESKAFVECAPIRFPFRVTAEGADGLVRYFEAGTLRIDPDLSRGGASVPAVATFAATASLRVNGVSNYPPPPEARADFITFVAVALGVTQEKAAELVGENFTVTLGIELGFPHARVELERYQKLALAIPPSAARQWYIHLSINTILPSIR